MWLLVVLSAASAGKAESYQLSIVSVARYPSTVAGALHWPPRATTFHSYKRFLGRASHHLSLCSYKVLEALKGEGKLRAIGISNYTVEDYLELKEYMTVKVHCGTRAKPLSPLSPPLPPFPICEQFRQGVQSW